MNAPLLLLWFATGVLNSPLAAAELLAQSGQEITKKSEAFDCGQSFKAEGEPLVLWHAWRDQEAEALAKVVAACGLPLKVTSSPFEGFPEKVSTALAHGRGPDLFIFAQDRMGQWLKAGDLATQQAVPGRFLPVAQEAFLHEGQSYGLPLASKSLVLFVNRALEEQPLEDLAMVPPRDQPLLWTTLDSYYHAFPFLAAAGAAPFDEAGQLQFPSESDRQGLEMLGRLVNELKVLPRSLNADQAKAAFIEGRATYLMDGPWSLDGLRAQVQELEIRPLPKVNGRPLRPFLGVDGVFVSAHSTRLELARSVASALASDRSAALRLERAGQLVPNLKVGAWAKAQGLRPLASQAMAAQVNGYPTPTQAEMLAIWGPAKDAVTAVVRQGTPAEDALSLAKRRIQKMLDPLPPPADLAPWFVVAGLLGVMGLIVVVRRYRADRLTRRSRTPLPTLLGFALPGGLVLILLVGAPILTGLGMSLFARGEESWRFVGFANYLSILASDGLGPTHPLSFWFTLVVTVLWTLINVALHFGIGLGLALLLFRPGLKFRTPLRLLLILPWAIPNYITALAWKGLFDEQFGAVNAMLLTLGLDPVGWWDTGVAAFTANLCTNVWLGFPFMMVTALGALSAIDGDQLEAARMDGAGSWFRLRHVILPQVMPAMVPALLLGTIWTFNAFNVIYLVSGGAPAHATDILVSEAYRFAFEGQQRYGYAAAYSVLIFGILVLFAWASTGVKRRRES